MAEESPLPAGEGSVPARSDELVDEAGKESFPASDPPATWSGVDSRDMDTVGDAEAPARRATGSS
jgi:hypothetical protein